MKVLYGRVQVLIVDCRFTRLVLLVFVEKVVPAICAPAGSRADDPANALRADALHSETLVSTLSLSIHRPS
jgi:hypothetical protein